MKMRWWSMGAVAAAMLSVGCQQKGTGGAGGEGSGVNQQIGAAQQQSKQALEKAKQAQGKAESEQKQVSSAEQEAQKAQQKAQEAEQKLQQERQQAQQAQQQAQQEAQTAQQQTSQSQQQAAQGQQQAAQQSEQQRQQELQKQQEQSTAMGGAGQAGQQQSVSGKVSSVQQDSIMLNTQDKGQLTLKVDQSTPVTIDGQQASLSQIEPGQEVRASYGQDMKAQNIEVTSGQSGPSQPIPNPMQQQQQ